MDFADFILQHQGEDLASLALSRDRLKEQVADFDLALTSLEVRSKLRTKVPSWYAHPSLQYPFRVSGEQCSSEETAEYKAALAKSAACGACDYAKTGKNALCEEPRCSALHENGQKCVTPCTIADLTGGLGVDSWAFARHFDRVLYNEMQPELARAAEHNFKVLGVDNVQVKCRELVPGNVAAVLDGFEPDVIFMDPARRAEDGRKVFRLEDCQPDVLKLLPELLDVAPKLLLKLSPMADISLICKQLACVREVHVVASGGECKELLLVLERGYEGERLTVIYENGSVLCVDQVQAGTHNSVDQVQAGTQNSVDQVQAGAQNSWTRSTVGQWPEGSGLYAGQVLFEPGKAMLKAGAFELPCRYGLRKLGRHTHYYTGMVPVELKPFGKCFEILEVRPLNNKTIKDFGKRYPLASVTARNIPLTSDQLRKKLGVKDGGSVHIFGLHADEDKLNLLLVCSEAGTPGTKP